MDGRKEMLDGHLVLREATTEEGATASKVLYVAVFTYGDFTFKFNHFLRDVVTQHAEGAGVRGAVPAEVTSESDLELTAEEAQEMSALDRIPMMDDGEEEEDETATAADVLPHDLNVGIAVPTAPATVGN